MSETILLQEFVAGGGRYTPGTAVIRGVKILGLESKNGRTYSKAAVEKAVGLYEGAKVNVNHPAGNHGGPRDYQDRIGRLVGVAVSPDGLRADFHFNPKHTLAEQLMWDAEHAPENVGFSHNVEANVSRRNGKVVVEEIVKVQSVDLVADPATTRGLFEGSDPQAEKRKLVESVADAIGYPRWCLPPLDTGLSYRHSAAEIKTYLQELWEVYVRRGIVEPPAPIVETAEDFARVATDCATSGEASVFAAAITEGGSADPADLAKIREALDLPTVEGGNEFQEAVLGKPSKAAVKMFLDDITE